MIVFIICFARTGGMILCETIGEHSEIIPLNEVLKWQGLIKKDKNYCVKLNYYEMRYSKLIEQGKDAKFISLNRDPYDIAASFKKIDQTQTDARKMLLGGGDRKDEPYLGAVKQYLGFLNWRKKFEALPNHLILNFEDMILKKEETFKKVFEFLGFEFEQGVKDFINKYISNDPVLDYPRKPIETWPYRAFSVSPNKKIGSYKDILSKKEIWKINSIIPMSAHAS